MTNYLSNKFNTFYRNLAHSKFFLFNYIINIFAKVVENLSELINLKYLIINIIFYFMYCLCQGKCFNFKMSNIWFTFSCLLWLELLTIHYLIQVKFATRLANAKQLNFLWEEVICSLNQVKDLSRIKDPR